MIGDRGPGDVWAEVWRLRREGAPFRGVPEPGEGDDDVAAPLGGWAPILDDEGNAYGEPSPEEPTDTERGPED